METKTTELRTQQEYQLYTKSNYDKEYDDNVVQSATERVLSLLSENGVDVHILNENEITELIRQQSKFVTFSKSKQEFDETLNLAVKHNGIIVTDIANTNVEIVELSKHHFNSVNKIDEAKQWAKQNLTTSKGNEELPKMIDGTEYEISNQAINKFLSNSATSKSSNLDIHLSVLVGLKDIIAKSIDVEIHPDYKKGDDKVRRIENGVNYDKLIHRLYGSITIEGKLYRVKTTMQEFKGNEKNKPHSYEVTKIELLENEVLLNKPADNTMQATYNNSIKSNNSISLAKLLKGVEKSYEKGTKLLNYAHLLEEIKSKSGEIFGFTSGNTIYLTQDGINPETPIHEYAHLWCKVMELTKPEFWTNVIVPYLKGSPVWNEVLADKRYSKIHDNDSRMASEVIARVSGRIGAKKLIKYAKETINESNEKHRGIKATLFNNMRKALQKFWTMVKNHIFKKPKYSIEEECIADMVVNDLIAGETVNETTLNVIEAGLETRQKQYISISESQLDYLNNKFNEELEKQINGTLPNNHIYELGMPGRLLRASGFPNLPIELSSARLLKKSKQEKHIFDILELKNLVQELNHPWAIFRYNETSKNIIVGISHEDKQFLVGITFNYLKKGIEVSDIRSIFPKTTVKWLNWIYQGKADYLDKEKIQTLIIQRRTNLAEVDYLDLNSVTKLIQNFENPILEEEKNKIFKNIDDIEFQFKQDYCNNFKQLDFKELKSKIKITEFAEYIGYKLRKDKTTHKHLIYEHSSGEKICIYNNPDGKPQIYMTIGGLNADKGDIISFVKNKIDNGIINKPINGTSPFEKVNILLHEYLNIPFEDRKVYNSLDEYIQKSKQNLFISDYQPYTGNITIKAVEYMSTRGLDSNDFLIYPFRGSVVGTNTAKIEADINKIPNNQVAFPLYDKNEKMVGVQLVSENYKSFLKGSRKSVGVWHSYIPEKINNIVICEAPLDAISYHKLQGDSNTLYFATCGNVTDGQLDAIKSIIENNKNVLAANYTITLANDNDAAGAMFNLNYILSTLDEKGNTNIHFNNTKDGRCDLMISLSSADTNNLLKLYDNLPKEDINLEIKAKDGGVNILYSKDIKTISALNDLLLTSKPQNIKIDVPITKDYNEDLKTLQHINSLSSDKYSYQDVKHNSFLFTDDISKFHKEKKKYRGIKF